MTSSPIFYQRLRHADSSCERAKNSFGGLIPPVAVGQDPTQHRSSLGDTREKSYGIGFNGAETNYGIAHTLGILLKNSYKHRYIF